VCGDLRRNRFGDAEQYAGGSRVRGAHDDWLALISAGTHHGVKRNLAQQRNTELFGHLATATGPEQSVAFAAVRTNEIAHVLDDPKDGHLDLLEHRDALDDVRERDCLRRRDDERAAQRHGLAQR